MLPFESVARVNFPRTRVSPATASGHGVRRCHTRFEVIDLVRAEPFDLELLEQPVENHPVQSVDVGPGQVATTDASHRRAVAGPPCIGEAGPIDPNAFGFG